MIATIPDLLSFPGAGTGAMAPLRPLLYCEYADLEHRIKCLERLNAHYLQTIVTMRALMQRRGLEDMPTRPNMTCCCQRPAVSGPLEPPRAAESLSSFKPSASHEELPGMILSSSASVKVKEESPSGDSALLASREPRPTLEDLARAALESPRRAS